MTPDVLALLVASVLPFRTTQSRRALRFDPVDPVLVGIVGHVDRDGAGGNIVMIQLDARPRDPERRYADVASAVVDG